MLFLYNILSLFALPFVLFFLGCRKKYRHRLPARLGWGLRHLMTTRKNNGQPTLWIHALSVGEVTSSIPLLRALRGQYPEACLLLSVTTASGKAVAERHLKDVVDCVLDGPIDAQPVVRHFLDVIAPDLYILVETDFWPGLLQSLKRRGIPALLVNGRISQTSISRYQRGKFFFLPMFQCFAALAMQTASDRNNMRQLGLEDSRLPILGNLKFATVPQPLKDSLDLAALLPPSRRLLVAGSTHPGEEELVFDAYCRLRSTFPELLLLLVPRDPQRGSEIVKLARQLGLSPSLRSSPMEKNTDLLIVDTLGELLACYGRASLAFVGGSLVAKGGHNPLEPASLGIPVLFGPHMEDFSEIAVLLLESGAAQTVTDTGALTSAAAAILADPGMHDRMGKAARQVVLARSDKVIANHLSLIRSLL